MSDRITVRELAAQVEALRQQNQTDHLKIDRNKVWLQLPAVLSIIAFVVFTVVVALNYQSQTERRFDLINNSLAQLAISIEDLKSGTSDRYRRSDAVETCLLSEVVNPTWKCPLVVRPTR